MAWNDAAQGFLAGGLTGFGTSGNFIGAGIGAGTGFLTGLFSKEPASVDSVLPRINAASETENYMRSNPFESVSRSNLNTGVNEMRGQSVAGAVAGGASLGSAERLADKSAMATFTKGNQAITNEVGNIRSRAFSAFLNAQHQRESERAAYQSGIDQRTGLFEDSIPMIVNAFANRYMNQAMDKRVDKIGALMNSNNPTTQPEPEKPLGKDPILSFKAKNSDIGASEMPQDEYEWSNNSFFKSQLERVFAKEGGRSNNANDRGGDTRFGISSKANPGVNLDTLTREGAGDIYYKKYYSELESMYNDNKWGKGSLAFAFDSSVQHGSRMAKKWSELAKGDLQTMYEYRKNYYDAIVANDPSQKKWYNGWMNRLNNEFNYAVSLDRNFRLAGQ